MINLKNYITLIKQYMAIQKISKNKKKKVAKKKKEN